MRMDTPLMGERPGRVRLAARVRMEMSRERGGWEGFNPNMRKESLRKHTHKQKRNGLRGSFGVSDERDAWSGRHLPAVILAEPADSCG